MITTTTIIVPPMIARLPLPSGEIKTLIVSRAELIHHDHQPHKLPVLVFMCICLPSTGWRFSARNMCCSSSVWGFRLLTLVKHGCLTIFFLAFKKLVLFFWKFNEVYFQKETVNTSHTSQKQSTPEVPKKAGFNNLLFLANRIIR